jgi:predicted ABC-type ATPase
MITKSKEMFLFAGPNGSGKSTIVNDFLQREICPKYYICPDNNINRQMKDIEKAYIIAMKKAEAERYNAVTLEKSFSFESVFSTTEKVEFIKYVKSQGYNITIVYVVTNNPQINIKRIHNRVLSGGHDVPEDKIISRYYKSMKQVKECIKVANSFFLFDNSGNTPILLLEIHDGEKTITQDYIDADWIKEYVD